MGLVSLELISMKKVSAFLLLCVMATGISAQDFVVYGGTELFLMNQNQAQALDRIVENSNSYQGNSPKGSSTQSDPTGLQHLIANFRYTPEKSRTRANLQAFIAKTRSVDPAGAAQMEQLFGSVDVIAEIGSIMASLGLSKDNAADAFAVYWISAWQAANGDTSDRSADTYEAVSKQVVMGFSQSPDFKNANNSQKQQMAEAMLVQAALIDGAKDQMSSDPAQMRALRQAVTNGASASGLDLDKMTLTEDGFAPAKAR